MRRWLISLGLAGVCWGVSSMGQAQDQRDEEIFGDSPKVEQPPPQGETTRVSGLSDTLEIGGRLELSLSQGVQEQQSLGRSSLQQQKTADIYFDSRPHKDARVFLRTRFQEQNGASDGEGSALSTAIDELWLKWDVDDLVFFTYGKQHLKWGSSRIWNPTDFTARELRDPLALFDKRLGQDMLKVHFPLEKQGHNLYFLLLTEESERSDDVGYALRGEFSIGSAGELALSLQTRRAEAQKIGFDLSSGLGPIDLTLELAAQRRVPRRFYRGSLDPDRLELPVAYEDRSRLFRQGVLGLRHSMKYSADDSLRYGLEYFHNELGYKDLSLELYSLIRGDSQSLYAGRSYLAAYILLPGPGSWNKTSWFWNGLHNLSDQTSLVRLTGTYTLYDQISIEAFAGLCRGELGELCFAVPESYKTLAELPGVDPSLKAIVERLPTRKTIYTSGISVAMKF